MLAEEIFRPYELSIPGNYCSRSWTSTTDQRLAAILPAKFWPWQGGKFPGLVQHPRAKSLVILLRGIGLPMV